MIPTEFVARLTGWALEEFFASGRVVAPSADAIRSTWADQLEQHEITLDGDTESDSVQWAVADLRANYARLRAEEIINDFARDMASADGPDRVKVFASYADRMFLTSQALLSRRNEMTGHRGVEDALQRAGRPDRHRAGHARPDHGDRADRRALLRHPPG